MPTAAHSDPGAPSAAGGRKSDNQCSLAEVGVRFGAEAVGMHSALQPHAQAPELRAAIAACAAAGEKELAAMAARVEQEKRGQQQKRQQRWEQCC